MLATANLTSSLLWQTDDGNRSTLGGSEGSRLGSSTGASKDEVVSGVRHTSSRAAAHQVVHCTQVPKGTGRQKQCTTACNRGTVGPLHNTRVRRVVFLNAWWGTCTLLMCSQT